MYLGLGVGVVFGRVCLSGCGSGGEGWGKDVIWLLRVVGVVVVDCWFSCGLWLMWFLWVWL